MEKVKVKKLDALEILRRNRTAHMAIFNEAVEGFRAQALRMLEERIVQIKDGRVANIQVTIPQPQNQTKEYDRAIKMLEMSIEDTVEFDEHAFAEYIMDDWNWKRQFLHSNALYSKTASDMSDGA